jgi:dTDP-4-dehydrorhamnose 3,5-epimerase
MEVVGTAIPEVKVLRPPKFADRRGFFSETYNRRALAEAGIDAEFVQDNHSLSVDKGVVRGLHYQIPPFAQHKLVRVIRGAVFDVAVDLRRGSPTLGKHVAVTLSAEEWNQLFVPIGFAHGFCTLVAGTEVAYKVTNYYSPGHERGIAWNDPTLGISWPVSGEEAILSDKDRRWPPFSELLSFFELEP